LAKIYNRKLGQWQSLPGVGRFAARATYQLAVLPVVLILRPPKMNDSVGNSFSPIMKISLFLAVLLLMITRGFAQIYPSAGWIQ
jgi:branched-subunit amino acid permease